MDPTQPDKAVYLHVGAPAAGGAFLQKALWANRRRLAKDGVRYPVAGPLEHFGAVMDLRDMTWGGHRDPAWEGAYERVAERARGWRGHTVVLSQELLGGADEQQVERAVTSFGDAEVHIVFATRDLGTQLILDWQEQIRHTHTITFERFVADLVEHGIDAPEPYGEMFWGLHDPVRVLRAWETAVPRERIHVITLPPSWNAPGLLWRRFCELTGIDAARYDVAGIPDDRPLSVIEAELMRRLNGKLAAALGGEYEDVVRAHLIGHALSAGAEAGGVGGGAPMALPDEHATWAARRTAEVVDGIRTAGYRVHGDLAELAAAPRPEQAVMPGELPDREVATALIAVIAELLTRLAEVRERVGLAQLHADLASVRDGLDRLMETAAVPNPALRRAAKRAGMGR
ncbi:hypothetical protein [Actinomadura formosensis]|uniref:hypothetical protein n=1 Tax=Actinomadura formosensis TaxID=60706 RepID=UPI003D8BA836